ncbi:MAG: NUDIX domain-containing protein [Candidatus Levybacteria bacterium]|nr:NUDIX domain-containing protein [Candidatus Levybacteria bacterium]
MKTRVIVSAVIKKGDEYLFGKKKDNTGPYPNTWHLVGGGVNLEEETLEEALKREVKEEADIEITNIKNISFDEDNEPNKHGELVHYVFLVFGADYKSGNLKVNDEMRELKWFKEAEIRNLSLPRPSQKLFSQLGII